MDEKQAIELLRKYSKGDKEVFNIIFSHSKTVQKVALDLSKNIPNIDIGLIIAGSLLHDIGRFDCPPKDDLEVRHGLKGGEILRKEGYEKLARIAERHIGPGITREDIEKQGLNLPKKDFVPETAEEKIIACADNLDHNGIITIEKAVERYTKKVNKEVGKRVKDLYYEIIDMKNK